MIDRSIYRRALGIVANALRLVLYAAVRARALSALKQCSGSRVRVFWSAAVLGSRVLERESSVRCAFRRRTQSIDHVWKKT